MLITVEFTRFGKQTIFLDYIKLVMKKLRRIDRIHSNGHESNPFKYFLTFDFRFDQHFVDELKKKKVRLYVKKLKIQFLFRQWSTILFSN